MGRPAWLTRKGPSTAKKWGRWSSAARSKRANLELLVFPWIEKRIREELDAAQADAEIPFIVLDAAIMLEAGWNNTCDRIVYVHAPRAVRLRTIEDAERLDAATTSPDGKRLQLPLSVKASRADGAIDNSADR